MLPDARLAGFFHQADMVELRQRQVSLFSAALGGSDVSVDTGIAERSGIYHQEFDLVLGYLADAARECGVAEALLGELLFAVAPPARDVVSVPAPDFA